MASVEEVKLHLATSAEQTRRAVAAIGAVADQMDEALARLRLTVVGSAHPSLMDAVFRLEQAKARLDEAAMLARASLDSAEAYRSIA